MCYNSHVGAGRAHVCNIPFEANKSHENKGTKIVTVFSFLQKIPFRRRNFCEVEVHK